MDNSLSTLIRLLSKGLSSLIASAKVYRQPDCCGYLSERCAVLPVRLRWLRFPAGLPEYGRMHLEILPAAGVPEWIPVRHTAGILFDAVCIVHGSSIFGALRNNDDAAVLGFRNPRLINCSSWSASVRSSGMMAASAPEAMALFWARYPASRPMTSTKKIRSCEVAVSRILSTHSTIVFRAVSYPMV